MAVTTSIAKGYAWRNVLIGIVCLGIGVWGIYDYSFKIPLQQLRTDRVELLRQCKAALETTQDTAVPSAEAQRALDAIAQQRATVGPDLQKDIDATRAAAGEGASADELRARLGEFIQSSGDFRWLGVLYVIEAGLRSPRGAALADQPAAYAAYQIVRDGLAAIGQVKKPARFDRTMQWLSISCLVAVPWCLWTVVSISRRRYALDDAGTLHLPEGTWKADEIADIDMGRWMAKSIAWVVHRDGMRVKLDDYKHEHLHLIVGALASRFHPDDWDVDARPKSSADLPRAAEPAEADEAAEAAAKT